MPRILIIDDEASVRTLFERALKTAGFEVLSAADGKAGADLHRATPADLVIVDLFMPEKEGLETIMELRAKSPNIPIIAISGGYNSSHEMLLVAQRLGADNILAKPISAEALVKEVKQALNHQ